MDWLDLRFSPPNGTQLLLDCSHAPEQVLLAYLVACLASYACLNFAERAGHAERPEARRNWSAVATVSLGTGVWSMHFIAMLAFQTPVAVHYDLPATIVSLLVAILATLLAIPTLSQDHPSLPKRLLAALSIGLGISLMHYSGMAAMRSEAQLYYHPTLFALSIVIAIVTSLAALQLSLFFRRQEEMRHQLLRLVASLVMGIAITSMHFTGMWALEMVVPMGTPLGLQSTDNSLQLGLMIALITLITISGGLGVARADRKLQHKKQDLHRGQLPAQSGPRLAAAGRALRLADQSAQSPILQRSLC